MSNFLSLLPEGGWQRLACDALWQSSLIGVVGLFAARFLARQSATRAWVLLLTISGCVVAPLVTLAARQVGMGVLEASPASLPVNALQADRPAELRVNWQDCSGSDGLKIAADPIAAPSIIAEKHEDLANLTEHRSGVATALSDPSGAQTSAVSVPIHQEPSAATFRHSEIDLFRLVGIAWLAASLVLVWRLLLSLMATRRLLQMAVPCEDEPLQAAARQAAQRIGLKKGPTLLMSAKVATPTVLAFRAARLLIPNDSNEKSTNGNRIDWVAAFTHELAHVARRDGWSRLWVELALIAIPLQPLVWLARLGFRMASEEACDDWAVAVGTNPVDLADTLAAWISAPASGGHSLAIGMSSTKSRALRLLALREKPLARKNQFWQWIGVPFTMVLLVGMAVAQAPKRKSDQKSAVVTPSTPTSPKTTSPFLPSLPTDADSKDQRKASEEKIEMAIAGDPLIALYNQRMQEWKQGLDTTLSKEDIKAVKERVKSYEEKINDRKIELRTRITQETRGVSERTPTNPTTPSTVAQYIIEPPDILEITPVQVIPKQPVRIQPGDKLQIDVEGTKYDEPIHGMFKVDSSGEVVLGPSYGSAKVSGLMRHEAQEVVQAQLEAALISPQVALTIDESRIGTGITGKHLVAPNGTINLGIYGEVNVNGQTIEAARKSIEDKLTAQFNNPVVSVDVFGYNSKAYYIIQKGPGVKGDSVRRIQFTGNERFLDAIAQLDGTSELSSAKIWIKRPGRDERKEEQVEIDWNKTLAGLADANPQILPGDRIFIERPSPQESDRETSNSEASSIDVDFGPPVVVKMIPEAGTDDVDPSLAEIKVTFSRKMSRGNWSWCHTTEDSFPKSNGDIKYLPDRRTCVMPVKLEPGKTYNIWLNSPEENGPRNFVDESGHAAAPYLLVFKTKAAGAEKN